MNTKSFRCCGVSSVAVCFPFRCTFCLNVFIIEPLYHCVPLDAFVHILRRRRHEGLCSLSLRRPEKATESKATKVAIVRLMVPDGWATEIVSSLPAFIPPALSINAIRNYVIFSSVYIHDESMPRFLASSTYSRVFSRLFFVLYSNFDPKMESAGRREDCSATFGNNFYGC